MTDSTAPAKKRGRPPGSKNKPKDLPAYLAQAEPSADPVPDVSVAETYFSAFGDKVTPGVGFGGQITDFHQYFDVPQDRQGNDLVDVRCVSWRPGCKERASAGGYVPALVNRQTRQLDVGKGEPVVIGPPAAGAHNMQFFVRPKESGDIRREAIKQMTMRHRRKAGSEAAEQLADELGVRKNLTIDKEERELIIPPK